MGFSKALFFLTSTLFATAACGGKVLTLDSSGGDDASPRPDAPSPARDAAPPDAAPPDAAVAACPADPPRPGQACAPLGRWCEYDPTEPNPLCNPHWVCSSSGWQPAEAENQCPPPGLPCPDSYADVPVGQSCPTPLELCLYPTGSCGCSLPASGGVAWACDPLPPACPSPIPLPGSSCTTPTLVCSYSPCQGGAALACRQGAWSLLVTNCSTEP